MSAFEDLADTIKQIVIGWTERIEYAIETQQHVDACATDRAWMTTGRLKHYTCYCPKARELRAESRTQPSLIQQLTESAYHVPQNGTGGGGSVNKPESKIPGNLAAPDELLRRLTETTFNAIVAWGLIGAPWAPADNLRQLHVAAQDPDRDPEDIHQLLHELRHIVRQARVQLGYDSQTVTFADTSCPECGGLLRVTRDIDRRTEVRCAGTPANLPCGARYPWHTWIDLLKSAA